MSEQKKSPEDVAADLARFLTTNPGGYGYGSGKSPLDEMLKSQITRMTREIAAEVIEATPELAAHVRKLVQQTVQMALRDDAWLNATVVKAVAGAITDLALQRPSDEVD